MRGAAWYAAAVPAPSSKIPRIAAAASAAACVFALANPARADASGWIFAGAGATRWKQTAAPYQLDPVLVGDAGVGTSPDGAVILGGLFRVQPVLGTTTDLGILARLATHGFQGGWFGLALDAGGYARFWGTQSYGFWGDLAIGGPLGLQLSLPIQAGTNGVFGVGAVAGIDFARLTVYRLNVIDWWPNPKPAQTRTARR